MKEMYKLTHSIESLTDYPGKDREGLSEKIVHLAGVFLFYILLFFAISMMSQWV